jgi:V-type H+-transporting ATPase subunit C
MDDIAKYDGQVESILRRIERQMIELDPKIQLSDFKVLFRQKTMGVDSYVRAFVWDDTKFPRNRNVADNLSHLVMTVQKIDEDVKAKAYTFSDIKQSLQNAKKAKSSGSTLATAELVEVLTPEVVDADDFIDKAHLVTLVVIVPRGSEKDFLASYEKFDEYVCPRSAKQFMKLENGKLGPIADKDGSTLWRVICFKSSVDSFKTTAKANKFTVRDFSYSVEEYTATQAKVKHLESEYSKQETTLKRHCMASYSDTLVAWMHCKAIRVFVEAILRYGVPPNFSAFIVRPTSKNTTKLRTILSDVFSASGLFGQNYIGTTEKKEGGAEGDDEAYYPYVSLNLAPFAEAKQS